MMWCAMIIRVQDRVHVHVQMMGGLLIAKGPPFAKAKRTVRGVDERVKVKVRPGGVTFQQAAGGSHRTLCRNPCIWILPRCRWDTFPQVRGGGLDLRPV